MARSTARAAVMQMIFENLAGGEGGEETLAMVYEALRHEGIPGVEIAENEPNKSDKASWEILQEEDVPGSVAINEAVNLATRYSEPTSGRFVNGVLGTILRKKEAAQ